jgi:hypothetical protein
MHHFDAKAGASSFWKKKLNVILFLCIFKQLHDWKSISTRVKYYFLGKQRMWKSESGSLPFIYLGIPIQFIKLKNDELKYVEDRFKKKLSRWMGKLIFYGDCLILITSVLTSLHIFMLYFLEIPKWVWKRLYFFHSRFFWQSDDHKKKYRLTKWNMICGPKEQGVGSWGFIILKKILT